MSRPVVLSGLADLLTLATGLVASLLLTRLLGPAAWGAYSHLLWLSSVGAVVLGAGLTYTGLRFTAHAVGSGDWPAARRLVVWLGLAQGGLALAGGVGLWPALPALAAHLGWATDPALLRAAVPAAAALALLQAGSFVLRGLQRFDLVLASAVASAGGTALVVAGVAAAPGVRRLILATALLHLLLAVGVWLAALVTVARRAGTLPRAPARLPVAPGALARYAVPVYVAALADQVVWQRSAVAFLAQDGDPRQTGYYALAYAVAQAAVSAPALPLTGVLTPLMAARAGAGDRAGLRLTFAWLLHRLHLIVAPATVGLWVLAPDLLLLLYGAAYLPAVPALRLLAVAAAIGVYARPGAALLHAEGRPGRLLALTLAALPVNLGLTWAWAPAAGALGAAWANLIAQALAGGLVLAAARRAVGPLGLGEPARRGGAVALACGLAAWAVTLTGLPLPGRTALAVLVGAAVYAAGLAVTGEPAVRGWYRWPTAWARQAVRSRAPRRPRPFVGRWRLAAGLALTLSLLAPAADLAAPDSGGRAPDAAPAAVTVTEERDAAGRRLLLYYLPEDMPARPRLVVRLDPPAAGVATASVFDAPPGRDHVPLGGPAGRRVLPPGLVPVVTVTAHGGWWARDSYVNYNLDLTVHGPVLAMWGADPAAGGWASQVRPGQPAVAISVRDPDGAGQPRWELRRLLPAFAGRGYYRASYAERTCDAPRAVTPPLSPAWPLVAHGGSFEQAAGRFQPPLVVDWPRGRLTHVAELVPVRAAPCTYAFYSIEPLAPGASNRPNFETPFAFYDLGGTGAPLPNLVVRTERWRAGEPWAVARAPAWRAPGRPPRDGLAVRYSWRQAPGDGRWDYKVEVLGDSPAAARTLLGDGATTIDVPPYAALPAWVVGHDWPVVTFVAAEPAPYRSSEGIYAWSPLALGRPYLYGWADHPALTAFQDIEPGLRGEYRLETRGPPRLYLSPVDRRLHLLDAAAGRWRLDDRAVIALERLGEGPAINRWTLLDWPRGAAAPVVVARLHALDGLLVYDDPEGVIVQAATTAPVFITTPPTDAAGWRELGERLVAVGERRDPRDLRAWLGGGPRTAIRGGQVDAVAVGADGLQVVVTLPPGYQVQGGDPLAAAGQPPGRYLLTSRGGPRLTPLPPPRLVAELTAAPVAAGAAGLVALDLHNQGPAPVSGTLVVTAEAADQPAVTLHEEGLLLPGGGARTLALDWQPPAPGPWRLAARLHSPEAAWRDLAATTVPVDPPPPAPAGAVLAASGAPPRLALLAASLAALGLLAAALAWHTAHTRRSAWHAGGPLLLAGLAGVYFAGRYGGHWAEADTATFRRLTDAVLAAGRLRPPGEVYPHGFAFQALGAMAAGLTGLDVATLQQVVWPLALPLVLLPAWALYREWTGSARGAALACLLLLAQPDLLFVLLRGSHEKFSRALLLLCLLLLVRGLRGLRPAWLAVHAGLFYLALFALIASNALLASSFVAALGTALGLGWLLARRRGQRGTVPPRLLTVCLVAALLLGLFAAILYPPAGHALSLARSIWQRLGLLLLAAEPAAPGIYETVAASWLSLPVYLALSLGTWLLLGVSAAVWLRQGWRWWRGVATPGPRARLLWLLYAAVALQGALAVAVDASGAVAGNLQHRVLPSIALVAAAVAGRGLAGWRPQGRWGVAALAPVAGLLVVLALLKATNEPLLGHKWTFYQPAELAALDWAGAHLRTADVWTAPDERLLAAAATAGRPADHGVRVRGGPADPTMRLRLVSTVTALRAARLGQPLPVPAGAARVYDNGAVQLYRLRPRTPHQR